MDSVYIAPDPTLEGDRLKASEMLLASVIEDAYDTEAESLSAHVFPCVETAKIIAYLCLIDGRLDSVRSLYADALSETSIGAEPLIQITESIHAIESLIPQMRLLYNNMVHLTFELNDSDELFEAIEKSAVERRILKEAGEPAEKYTQLELSLKAKFAADRVIFSHTCD